MLAAILMERVARLSEVAGPWPPPPTPTRRFSAEWSSKRSGKTYVEALADASFHSRIARSPVGQEAVPALGALLARAESAGAVRDDIGVAELIALVVGASRAAEHAGQDGASRARILQIVFDRLRPVERSLR